MPTYYCGIDLHARNSQLCVIDADGKPVAETKLDNDLPTILDFLAPYGSNLPIAIESTLNWYWLVDGLQEVGYPVHLAHTLGLFMITGAKVKTDRRDAFKLAKYLRLDELPEAYIYPTRRKPVGSKAHGRARRDVWCRGPCNRCPKDESDSSAQKQGKNLKKGRGTTIAQNGMKKKIKIILDKSLSRDVRGRASYTYTPKVLLNRYNHTD